MKLPTNDPKLLTEGLYKTDIFNLNPMFAVQLQNKQQLSYVRSWEEAFAIHGEAYISDINPAYVASLITNVQTNTSSPYKRIKRLPRANFIKILRNGDFKAYPYEPFGGGVSSQKERELHNIIDYIFQNKLKNAIPQGENRIGCELSSGLDSNAIVGGLIKGLDIDPRNIFTWSHDGNGEESYIKEFQTFHKLNTENTHINKTEYKKENFQESLKENLFIFGMPHQLGGNTECIKFFKKCSCKILFSGFGGDQAISHNGHNLATDLIKNFEFIEFFQWMDNPLKALKTMLGRTYGLINNDWQESKFSKKVSHMKKNNLLISLLTEKGKDWLIPHLSKEFIAEIDTYSTLHNSIRQRCMSQWVSVRLEEEVRLAAKYGIRKYFPLLDETLLGTLLNQDPKYFAEKYLQGRLIHRKSFAKYLPEKLRLDPSKYRDINNQWTAFEREKQAKVLNDLIEFSQQWNQHLSKFWQLDELKKYAINTQINIKKINIHESSKVIKAMRTVNKLSCWFSELE